MTKLIEKEAKKELKKLEEIQPNWFCPLINGTCEEECICYCPPKLKNVTDVYDEEDHYHVVEGRCSNKLFQG